MPVARPDTVGTPTFLYRGERFLWGYSPDRQVCGLWDVGNPEGLPHRSWPISDHAAAWQVFRDTEPRAVGYGAAQEAAGEDLEARGPSQGAGAADAHASEGGVSWRRVALIVLALLVVAGGAAVAYKRLRPSGATVGPAQAVLDAATDTVALHTAHMSMTETVTGVPGASSTTMSVPAVGDVDFSANKANLVMTIDGQQASVVVVDGTLYVGFPQISQLAPGKGWVSVPIGDGQSAGAALGGGDPSQMLQFLETRGNTVNSLGSSTVDGVPVQGYGVVVDKAAVESQLGNLGLPSAVVQAGEQFLRGVGPITYKVYVDSANNFREMDFATSVPSSTNTVSISAKVDFTDFGEPVSVSAPPASDVVSLQQFLQASGSSLPS